MSQACGQALPLAFSQLCSWGIREGPLLGAKDRLTGGLTPRRSLVFAGIVWADRTKDNGDRGGAHRLSSGTAVLPGSQCGAGLTCLAWFCLGTHQTALSPAAGEAGPARTQPPLEASLLREPDPLGTAGHPLKGSCVWTTPPGMALVAFTCVLWLWLLCCAGCEMKGSRKTGLMSWGLSVEGAFLATLGGRDC